MEKPDIDLCEKIVKSLKALKEKDGVFVEGVKKADRKDKEGDFLFGLSLASILSTSARTGLLVLITQLGIQPCRNIENSYLTPSDFDMLLKDAEETIALFK